jgi:hypothetical protein
MADEIATQEAYEEAGLIGRIVNKRPVGNYHYEKRLAKEDDALRGTGFPVSGGAPTR